MNKTQSALDAVDAALAALQDEVSEHADGRGRVSNSLQLELFKTHLETMKRQLTSETVPPRGQRVAGMGQAIADSWPFDHPLGAALLRAEQLYLKV